MSDAPAESPVGAAVEPGSFDPMSPSKRPLVVRDADLRLGYRVVPVSLAPPGVAAVCVPCCVPSTFLLAPRSITLLAGDGIPPLTNRHVADDAYERP